MRVREQQPQQSPPEPRQAAATTSARSTSQGSGHKPLAATAVTIPGVFELRKAR